MIIRAAQMRDAPVVTSLWNGMIRDTLATFTHEEKLYTDIEALIMHRAAAFWVAEKEGALLGFMTYGSFRGGPGYAATGEHTIILTAEAQGHGVGRALITHGLRAAALAGIHVMVAGISSANPGAVQFHEKLGFMKTGHLPEVGRKRDQWLDLILMQKTLTPP